MTKITTKTLFLVLLSLAASTALSQTTQGQNNNCQRTACVRAPEIDPAQALGALALLGGTVAIIRGYHRRKK
jgi:hypothetical protein